MTKTSTEKEGSVSTAAEEPQPAANPAMGEEQSASSDSPGAPDQEAEPEEQDSSDPEDTEELEEGANDAAPSEETPAASTSTSAVATAAAPNQPQEEDPRSDIEKQPYEFDRCTVQIAIQLLPNDGEANGRPVLIGVRTHLDAPIVRMMRANELGDLPHAITTLVEQLKGELPALEQAARERWAKEKESRARGHTKASPAKEAKTVKAAKPVKPKTVGAAAAPAPSVLTDEQRANAVGQAATANKQQMALF
ncbi:MAG: hypothetical protein M1570_09565 [Chloroflexi bacterium]|nr:hypothetical protein [Chloroflexota bacterium]